MTLRHYAVLAGAVILFCLLLFGFDKIPPKQKALEKSGSLRVESTGLQNLLNDAMPELDPEQKSVVEAINLDIQKSTEDSARVSLLKLLSGSWYRYGYPSISGVYAEEVAILTKDEASWSLAGTTFSLCVQNSENQKVKDFCSRRAVQAFENAISIDPEKIEPRINLALCYVDNPEKDNPMKGILMLRDLNEKYPENIQVLTQLARLALRTNQTDKAIERLEKILELDPKNQSAICMIADVYKSAGKQKLYEEFVKKCIR